MQIYDYFDIHTHHPSHNKNTLEIQNIRLGVDNFAFSDQLFSIGYHPYDVEKYNRNSLVESLKADNIVAIGEIGLDFRNNIFNSKQTNVFEQQLDISKQHDLPVIIHCVKAFPQVINLLKKHNIEGAIFHGFNNSEKIAKDILNNNFAISFGGNLLHNNQIQELFKVTLRKCSEQIFFETDDSEIKIEDIYKIASDLSQTPLEELKQIIKNNFNIYFNE